MAKLAFALTGLLILFSPSSHAETLTSYLVPEEDAPLVARLFGVEHRRADGFEVEIPPAQAPLLLGLSPRARLLEAEPPSEGTLPDLAALRVTQCRAAVDEIREEVGRARAEIERLAAVDLPESVEAVPEAVEAALAARRTERRIIALRFTRRWGPHRIGYHLGIARATVGRVLARYRMPLLVHLDQATGLPVRRRAINRYEAVAPGDLVHVDI